jgi:hypothetical protein
MVVMVPAPQDERYYWFPAVPFFEDVNAPEILLNQDNYSARKKKSYCPE